MRIAFLASNRNPRRYLADTAFIYRCENPGHALRAMGLDVSWGHIRGWRRHAADCVVVHRPRVAGSSVICLGRAAVTATSH